MEKQGNDDPLFYRTAFLIARFNDNFLELGNLLRELQETAPDDFRRLVAIRQLGKRKAYYLMEVARAFANLDVPRFRLSKIGWTKLQIIAPHINPDNSENLLTLAETNTAINLKAIVRGEKPTVGGRSVLLFFTAKQFDAFSKAILKHGAVKNAEGFLNKEKALIKAVRKGKG
jgi:hypothetical protein